jgi:hypothetical protein
MQCAYPNGQQMMTVFGGEFVQEQHRGATDSYLAPAEKHDFAADFGAVLKALRSALSLR